MRKPTKSSLKRRLDKICSEIVRARGKCERCGKKDSTLQCCHIFSRKFNNTRHSLDNLLCLCASCHFWSHSCPTLFTEFVFKKIGEDKYNLLKEAHNLIYKPTIEDLEIKLKVLTELTQKI